MDDDSGESNGGTGATATNPTQVYEYYISHHLSKAFESLFGSVTCLPGCFSLYRIRTADKGRPIIISNRVIEDYAEPNVDTLHKKNLFSLGEDRYLTTLLLKHFPTFRTKFTPDAVAHTVAPESTRVLFSQRRRWINSTVHNLCELIFLPELCGFCLFSMRFFVFIDLLGTLVRLFFLVPGLFSSAPRFSLRQSFTYGPLIFNEVSPIDFVSQLVYLIVVVATGSGAFPLISIVMIAAVYGLQVRVELGYWRNHADLSQGSRLHHQTRVYARWLDGCLHSIVSQT